MAVKSSISFECGHREEVESTIFLPLYGDWLKKCSTCIEEERQTEHLAEYKSLDYSYYVQPFSAAKQFLGRCEEFPSITYIGNTSDESRRGIYLLIKEIVRGRLKEGVSLPEPELKVIKLQGGYDPENTRIPYLESNE